MRDKYANISVEDKQRHFDKLNVYNSILREKPILKSLFLEMTLNCNEHCLHCGSKCGDNDLEKSLTDYEILQILMELKNDITKDKLPLPFLSITGGEPMLRPHLPELMKTIHTLGYNWGMTSNGTLIDEELALSLKDAGMYSIGLSLDGLKESHEWFRNAPGSYEKVWDAFHALTKAEIESVMITTVVHRKNIHELDALWEEIKSHGCKLWRVINMEPIGRALEHEDLLLHSEDYQYLMDFIAKHQDAPDIQVIYSCNHYVGLEYERKVRSWYYSCRAGVSVASIQYNGDISACLDIERRPELIFGNAREENFYSVWKNSFQIYRELKSLKSQKCKACPHADNCNGGGFHTWNFDTNEPRICMMEELGLLHKEDSVPKD